MSYQEASDDKLNDESLYFRKPRDFRSILKNYDPSLIKHRLPNVIFTGLKTFFN